jgi:hypothetical protein
MQYQADPLSSEFILLDSFSTMTLAQMDDMFRCVQRFDALGVDIFRAHDSCERLTKYWGHAKEDQLYDCIVQHKELDPDDGLSTCIGVVWPPKHQIPAHHH